MTVIAMRNLAVGLPPVEQLRMEVDYANMKPLEEDSSQNEPQDETGHAELWRYST